MSNPDVQLAKFGGQLEVINQKLIGVVQQIEAISARIEQVQEQSDSSADVFNLYTSKSEFREFLDKQEKINEWTTSRMAIEKFVVAIAGFFGAGQLFTLIILFLEYFR